MTTIRLDPGLVAERDQRVADHMATRPPWWRLLERRRWKQKLRALHAMDVSYLAAMLRVYYPASEVERMAARTHPALTKGGR